MSDEGTSPTGGKEGDDHRGSPTGNTLETAFSSSAELIPDRSPVGDAESPGPQNPPVRVTEGLSCRPSSLPENEGNEDGAHLLAPQALPGGGTEGAVVEDRGTKVEGEEVEEEGGESSCEHWLCWRVERVGDSHVGLPTPAFVS